MIIGDAFGEQVLTQFRRKQESVELIERDDGYMAIGAMRGLYFTEHDEWSKSEKEVLSEVAGRVLDIGCGAGRHSLYVQSKGLEVTAIDLSPGAVKLAKMRGVKKAIVRSINEVDLFKEDSFETVLMLGNNFGLFGSAAGAKRLLRKLARVTTSEATIIAGSRDPYKTRDKNHLEYHRFNIARGRMSGQLRIRIRFERLASRWFNYLMVSPKELSNLIKGTGWTAERFVVDTDGANYFAIIRKN
jgi:SAM-dependent methyltransferase